MQASPAAILVCVVNTEQCRSDGATARQVLLKLECNAMFCWPFYRLCRSIYIIYVSD